MKGMRFEAKREERRGRARPVIEETSLLTANNSTELLNGTAKRRKQEGHS